jgi:hypothetical protein
MRSIYQNGTWQKVVQDLDMETSWSLSIMNKKELLIFNIEVPTMI